MALNPYKPASRDRFPVTASRTDLRTGRTRVSDSEPFFDAQGEINASNKKDLIMSIASIIDGYRRNDGGVGSEAPKTRQAARKVLEENLQSLREAFHDRQGNSFQVIGETMGDEIYETMGRQGIARHILNSKTVGMGEVNRVRVRKKDVVGWQTTTAGMIVPSVVKNHWVYPEETYLIANIHIEDRDIAQADVDILDEKFQDGLEQIMKKEDDYAKIMFDNTVGVANPQIVFGTLTPNIFSRLRTSVGTWGIPPTSCVLAWNLWDDFLTGAEFAQYYDPATKREVIQEGMLGSFMDVTLYTDGIRYSTLRVLADGEIYVFGPPEATGEIGERISLTTKATDQYMNGRPIRGWFMEQCESITVPNSRSVAKGLKA